MTFYCADDFQHQVEPACYMGTSLIALKGWQRDVPLHEAWQVSHPETLVWAFTLRSGAAAETHNAQ